MKFREKTTPFHYLCGGITILSGYFLSPWLGVGLWVSFLAIEIWDREEWASSKDDFWEFIASIFICSAIILILKLVGVI